MYCCMSCKMWCEIFITNHVMQEYFVAAVQEEELVELWGETLSVFCICVCVFVCVFVYMRVCASACPADVSFCRSWLSSDEKFNRRRRLSSDDTNGKSRIPGILNKSQDSFTPSQPLFHKLPVQAFTLSAGTSQRTSRKSFQNLNPNLEWGFLLVLNLLIFRKYKIWSIYLICIRGKDLAPLVR